MSKRKPFATPVGKAGISIAANSVDLGVLKTGHVVIQFGSLVQHMTFTPDQARQLGQGFIEMATKCEILYPAGEMNVRASKAVNEKSKVF